MNNSSIITGFLCGLLSSIIVSFVWYKLLVPHIKFTNKICRYKSTSKDDVYTYKIKFRNIGKRSIFELKLYCVLYLQNLKSQNYIHTVYLNLSYDFKPVFKSRGKKAVNPDGLVRICLNDTNTRNEFIRPLYSAEIQYKAFSGKLTIEDLLKINDNAYIIFYIIGFDAFSGSKRLFESKKYTIDDIHIGKYKKCELFI